MLLGCDPLDDPFELLGRDEWLPPNELSVSWLRIPIADVCDETEVGGVDGWVDPLLDCPEEELVLGFLVELVDATGFEEEVCFVRP